MSLAMPDSEPLKPIEPMAADLTGVPRIVARPAPRRRNQLFAITLTTVIAGIFIAIMTFAFVFHYAEAHHTLANL
jgi:hypothetical protein